MKKLLFSIALLATGFAFGQINLVHTFPANEDAAVYINDNQLLYCTQVIDQPIIKIYGQNYDYIKTLNITMPAGYEWMIFHPDLDYQVSKNIFNTNDKLEFIVYFHKSGTPDSKLKIIDEDGTIIKDFPGTYRVEYTKIYHDPIDNTNKIKLLNETTQQTEIYSLPTTVLANKEIMTVKNKLAAFPIPAKTTLKINNPQNNASKVEVFDTTGKLVINQTFSSHDDLITLNVQNLTNGLYIYKIGDLSSKFIKE
ncbi:T9SS C-terminal target domain-containing protein [Chryseobacterium sp. G0162]|uniref:T9SS type A sorting domain-containing protein n=1 Tax=Chryseobacterium sp. G0162 TaxID=2487063 RepID=UPI000F4ED1FD|nr:T9SS type A sorting domain-containing protein [Chryseobacterium sp. G0162]AZB08019.1 T9SS C-terminal target domain-containing protein [Chryseobacterium sp. G0162]